MNKQSVFSTCRHIAITTSISVLLGLGIISTAQASSVSQELNAPFMVAAVTRGADDRQDDRQDDRGDRQDDRGDRNDDRQDCRQDEGVGKDKRDCKQDARRDR